MKCVIKNCDKKTYCKNLCSRHYQIQHFGGIEEYRKYIREQHYKHRAKRLKHARDRYKNNISVRQQLGISRHERYKSDRLLVLQYYSKSVIPKCINCGFSDIRGLSLDHINNDGAQLKKTGIGNSRTLAEYLIKNDFPKNIQVLCANCNTIKEMDRRETEFNMRNSSIM